MKIVHRKNAVVLRRKGLTYREILAKIPVAKSTLSLWLKKVRLTRPQLQHLTEKRRLAQLRGGAARKRQRLETTARIVQTAKDEIGVLTIKELWLIGSALYWAEGSKEKIYSSATGIDFSNTDSRMIGYFIRWLKLCCKVNPSRLYAHLYIHEYQKERVPQALSYWIKMTGLSREQITAVYFKRHNPKSNRHTFNNNYYGTLRVRVRSSSELVRQIQGWVNGFCEQHWGVV